MAQIRLNLLFGLSVVLTIVFGILTAASTDYDYGDLILIDLDFENRSYKPWTGQYSLEGRNFSVSETSSEGRFSGRFHIGRGDYWQSPNTGAASARSEIQLKNTTRMETEIFYAWDLRIDRNYAENSEWQIIGQFHDQPDPALGQSWSNYPANSPPLSYRYRNGELILSVYSWETNGVLDVAAVPLQKGAWNRIVTRVFWSTTDSGFVEAWLNGALVIGLDGRTRYSGRNCFNNACNYLKIGLYRSKSIQTAGSVYFDRVRSGFTFGSVN